MMFFGQKNINQVAILLHLKKSWKFFIKLVDILKNINHNIAPTQLSFEKNFNR
jgi:hypothetical protein